jgi:hypothetical protein
MTMLKSQKRMPVPMLVATCVKHLWGKTVAAALIAIAMSSQA